MTAFVVNRSNCRKNAVGFFIWFCITHICVNAKKSQARIVFRDLDIGFGFREKLFNKNNFLS